MHLYGHAISHRYGDHNNNNNNNNSNNFWCIWNLLRRILGEINDLRAAAAALWDQSSIIIFIYFSYLFQNLNENIKKANTFCLILFSNLFKAVRIQGDQMIICKKLNLNLMTSSNNKKLIEYIKHKIKMHINYNLFCQVITERKRYFARYQIYIGFKFGNRSESLCGHINLKLLLSLIY